MKIGILGTPGSGKSEFAKELARALVENNREDQYVVIDNYVDALQEETGLEYGGFGDFIDDMQVVFKRRELELKYKNHNTITCGTVLDSTIHNFIRAEETVKTREAIGQTTQRLQAIAGSFGLVYTESWDYDYAFVLSTDDKMGRALTALLTTYRAPVLSFNPEVKDDEKASTAAAAIRTLEEEQPPTTDERRVRRGSEAGAIDGDSSEPVPDVSEQRGTTDDS